MNPSAWKALLKKKEKCVLLKRYCEITGETRHAVYARRRKGEWPDGVICHLGPNRKLWINLTEAQQWIQQTYQPHARGVKPPRQLRA